jgi:hypothetical protein
MSTSVQSNWTPAELDHEAAYRPLSALAVASCIWAVVSLAALVDWSFVALPAVGMVLGVWAWQRVRRNPDTLAGRGVAIAGLVANALVLVAACITLSYIHALDIPPGCIAVNYDELQPDTNVPGEQISARARELDGRRVLLKGYALAGRHTDHIKQFVLMRDNRSCCFGANPKLTDMVAVTLTGKQEWTYSPDMLRVAGEFHVVPPAAGGTSRQPVYRLDADYLQ